MKIYTKVGDKGSSSLYDGRILRKHNQFFEVLGDIDELSCNIGLLYVNDNRDIYRFIQQKLLDIGSQIATIDIQKKSRLPTITEDDVNTLEKSIDDMEGNLPKLTVFILPGACVSDAVAQICRAVTRRAERSVWKLYDDGYIIDDHILKFMNRLSDFFFVIARDITYKQKLEDTKRTRKQSRK